MKRFPAKSEKHRFWAFLPVFYHKPGFSGGTEIFSENPAVLFFLKFLSGTSLKISERFNERFPSKKCFRRTDGRTDGRTDIQD